MREGEKDFDEFDSLFASKKRESFLLPGRPSLPLSSLLHSEDRDGEEDADHVVDPHSHSHSHSHFTRESVERMVDYGPVHREEIVGLYQAIDIAGLQNLTPDFLRLFAPKRTVKQIMMIIESPQFSEYVRKHRAMRLRRSLAEQDMEKSGKEWVWVQCKFKNASSRRRALDLRHSIQDRIDRLLRRRQLASKNEEQQQRGDDSKG
eukprot:TRINITY_DN1393_c0_g1_i4.p1 TRINITY_DN1393_c0_g1~~TRINITY_DN1393_c0_g1_i4.p1  ORF type:complete len:215 (-),score=60.34 TRINITY_DN1393_c0_g1_i4:166-780(-)